MCGLLGPCVAMCVLLLAGLLMRLLSAGCAFDIDMFTILHALLWGGGRIVHWHVEGRWFEAKSHNNK